MVNNSKVKKPNFLIVGLLFFIFTCKALFASFVLQNDEIIGQRAIPKIETMGTELFNKTGVKVYIIAIKSLGGKNIVLYEKELAKDIKAPFVMLTLAYEEQKVDIFASSDVIKRFDKESVLSPYPWKGTIVPLLSVKKNHDKYTAALLNGYADIVEQIAKSYDVVLDSAIGSTNKSIMAYLRALFYVTIVLVFGVYMYKKMRSKNAAK